LVNPALRRYAAGAKLQDMTKVEVHAGVCGFKTIISAKAEDEQTIAVSLASGCPNLKGAAADLGTVDAYTEIFSKPHEGVVYKTLSQHVPHTACPIYSGILKAIEAEAKLALPRDASIRFIDTETEA
jgi:hypothetical protein